MTDEVAQFLEVTQAGLDPQKVAQLIEICGSVENSIEYFFTNGADSADGIGSVQVPNSINSKLNSLPKGFKMLSDVPIAPLIYKPPPLSLYWTVFFGVLSLIWKIITFQLFSPRINESAELDELSKLNLPSNAKIDSDLRGCTYKQALARAHKDALFLCVVMYSDLEKAKNITELDLPVDKTLFWFGNCGLEETKYVRSAYKLKPNSFVVIAPTIGIDEFGTELISTQILVVGVLNTSFSTHKPAVNAAINAHTLTLDLVKQELKERELDRKIRDEQQNAYQKSLETDKLKAQLAEKSREFDAYAKSVLAQFSANKEASIRLRMRFENNQTTFYIQEATILRDIYAAVHAWVTFDCTPSNDAHSHPSDSKHLSTTNSLTTPSSNCINPLSFPTDFDFQPSFVLKSPILREQIPLSTKQITEFQVLCPSGVLIVDKI